MTIKYSTRRSKSGGAVLIVSLVMLLIMTFIGISSIDSSQLQSQMARNTLFAQNLYQATLSEVKAQHNKMSDTVYLTSIMLSTQTFDNSEGISCPPPTAALGLVNDENNVAVTDTAVDDRAYFELAQGQFETHKSSSPYTQHGWIAFCGNSTPPPGYSLGTYIGKSYEVNPVSEVIGSSAESDQTQGLNRPAPKS